MLSLTPQLKKALQIQYSDEQYCHGEQLCGCFKKLCA